MLSTPMSAAIGATMRTIVIGLLCLALGVALRPISQRCWAQTGDNIPCELLIRLEARP
jgi:hypothetical protein